MKTQRGMTILHHSHGDLKLLVNELDIDILTAEDSGQVVFDHIKTSYSEYLEKKLPKAIEQGLYDHDGHRKRDETMLQYISRKKTLLDELEKAKCPLPSHFKGYVMMRNAKLPDKAWDTIETWLGELQTSRCAAPPTTRAWEQRS